MGCYPIIGIQDQNSAEITWWGLMLMWPKMGAHTPNVDFR